MNEETYKDGMLQYKEAMENYHKQEEYKKTDEYKNYLESTTLQDEITRTLEVYNEVVKEESGKNTRKHPIYFESFLDFDKIHFTDFPNQNFGDKNLSPKISKFECKDFMESSHLEMKLSELPEGKVEYYNNVLRNLMMADTKNLIKKQIEIGLDNKFSVTDVKLQKVVSVDGIVSYNFLRYYQNV